MKTAWFSGYVYDFSVDWDIIHSQVFYKETWYTINKILRFIKRMIFTAMAFFTCNS